MSSLGTKSNVTKFTDNRGNWEFSFFQKKVVPNEEQAIKVGMRPENGFDPRLVHQYINPQQSKEEIIFQRNANGETLNKAERIILENYLEKKDKALNEDIKALEKFGLNAKPQTNEGRTRLLLLTLQHQISKGNYDLVCNIFLRLYEDQFKLSPAIEKDFAKSLTRMREIVEMCDLTEIQFTKLHDQMPPLNTKGFQKFDPWQVDVITNIDDKKSTVVSAPTSAGKSVLSGYATTKGKTMIVVPTDALAWQMASYIGGVLNTDVPILTPTYQSIPKRELMVELINTAPAIVGTADSIVDYLPLISTKFEWIIFDEIHMIGKPDGSSMETIAKVYKDVPFLALSATIGNVDELTTWFQSLNNKRNVGSIVCDKRFFNLQRYYYNTVTNKLDVLHPLSLVEKDSFEDGSILKKNLQPTPPDTWILYKKMIEVFGDLGELNHKVYFESKERIQLSKANKYFMDLVKFMVDNYDEEKVTTVINGFKNTTLSEEPVDLVKLAFLLKTEDKTPAIIFQKNTIACLRMVRQFAKIIEELEDKKFPRLRAQRLKEQKKARRLDKQKEKEEDKSDNSKGYDSKKQQKKFLDPEKAENDFVPTALQEPTMDFTLNHEQYFAEGIVEGWVEQLKKFYPCIGEEYHFMIKLLWRGIGVYAKGLPDPYLRLVQGLAAKKQLAIVFSDMSLVFGVSMPFRTVVIYRDSLVEDDLDAMLYHQMAGRAGRRGLDKKGNVIFAGYKWKRIEELSICPIPNVTGRNNLNFVTPHACRMAEKIGNGQDWEFTFTHCLNGDSDEDSMELLEGIKSNYDNGWNFAISDDINHLHMMWTLRHSDEPVATSFIIPYLTKAFEGVDPNIENNQINIAHFLSFFVNKYETDNVEYKLPECYLFEQASFSKIFKIMEDLQLETTENIDGRVWISIKNNKLYKCTTEKEADTLRQRLFEFGNRVKAIQHFCFHNKITNISRLLGKLLTRIWWIYHMSSPIMRPFNYFDEVEYENASDDDSNDDSDSASYESDSYQNESDEENNQEAVEV
jgi:DEAD/DEAH box helicase